MKEVETEIDEGARDLVSIHTDMIFKQVPSARSDDQHRGLWSNLIRPARLLFRETNLAKPIIEKIDLPKKRQIVKFNEIPKVMVDAVLASSRR